eukprot:gene36781-63888_t
MSHLPPHVHATQSLRPLPREGGVTSLVGQCAGGVAECLSDIRLAGGGGELHEVRRACRVALTEARFHGARVVCSSVVAVTVAGRRGFNHCINGTYLRTRDLCNGSPMWVMDESGDGYCIIRNAEDSAWRLTDRYSLHDANSSNHYAFVASPVQRDTPGWEVFDGDKFVTDMDVKVRADHASAANGAQGSLRRCEACDKTATQAPDCTQTGRPHAVVDHNARGTWPAEER